MLAMKIQYVLADLLEQRPDDENIYDILGGDLVVWTSPADPHAAVVTRLVLLLALAEVAGFGGARTAPRTVAFDWAEQGLLAEDVTHPDVFFVSSDRRGIMGYRCIEGTADLVVEVLSPSTRADDLPGGRKFAIYERYGVRYYWIADTDERTITRYEWHDGHFGEGVVPREGDSLASPLFPGISRSVAEIFAAIL